MDEQIKQILAESVAAVIGPIKDRFAEWAAWAAPLMSEYVIGAKAGATEADRAESQRRLEHLLGQAEAKAAVMQIAVESHAAAALRAIVVTVVKTLVAVA